MFPESTVAAEGDSIHRSLVKINSQLHDLATAQGVAGTTDPGVTASATSPHLYQNWNRLLYGLNQTLGLV